MKLIFLSLLIFSEVFASFKYRKITVKGTLFENKDLSAISCMVSINLCLLASDETNLLQWGSFNKQNELVISTKGISLGSFKKENDIEALTHDQTYFYAVGSHGLSRKKSEYQPSRYKIFRLKLGKNNKLLEIKKDSLESLLVNSLTLKKYLKKPLSRDGLNIEGLGYFKGHLYIGLRSPTIGKSAFILKIATCDLFKKSQIKMKLIKLELGSNRGIRSLEFFGNNLYIISGVDNSTAKNIKAKLHILNAKNFTKIKQYSLPFDDKKIEGMEVLSSKSLILIYDSLKNGMPIQYSL